MSGFAEDDNLCFGEGIILLPDAPLQLEYHRTGSIDEFYATFLRHLICLWRFTVCSQQHLHVPQLKELLVVNGDKSHLLETLTLHPVVHNVPQTVEFSAPLQFFFGLADGSGDTETEPTATVNLYLQLLHLSSTFSLSHLFCCSMLISLLSRSRASSAFLSGDTSLCESI